MLKKINKQKGIKVNKDKNKYEPAYKWSVIMFLLIVAILGPITAETKPDNNIMEIVVGMCCFETLSAAAKRYCAVNARPNPRIKFAKQ